MPEKNVLNEVKDDLILLREQIQEDLRTYLDGKDNAIIDGVCQIIVDRFKFLVEDDSPKLQVDERNQCPCGSGEFKEPQFDGHGIFLCYTCDKCHQEKMSHYRSDIMENYECDEPIEPEDY